jgi:hypothetical protein
MASSIAMAWPRAHASAESSLVELGVHDSESLLVHPRRVWLQTRAESLTQRLRGREKSGCGGRSSCGGQCERGTAQVRGKSDEIPDVETVAYGSLSKE